MEDFKHSRFMRALRSGSITVSLALCVLGILLIAVPGFSLKAICVIGGLLLCAAGVLRLMQYFGGEPDLLSSFRMPGAVLLLLMGLFLLFRSDSAIGLTGTVLGIAVLLYGVGKLRSAMVLRRSGRSVFDSGLVSAVLILLGGALLLLRPLGSARLIMSLVGVVALLLGAAETVSTVRSVKLSQPEEPPIIEAKYREM